MSGAQDDRPDPGRLTFPDLPRLELDQLLAQLVERAQEVMGTQGRLRGLLRATTMITSDLALPALLTRIVEAARELVGAHYAALGVIGPDGQLAEFVHVGMPAETLARLGHLPEGKGLLGALVEDPRPIRLARLQDDPRSTGFPAGHPPMASFLGVPIRVRDAVFGNLYLTDSVSGGFSAEDEELALALAAAAGTAIDNARLYQTARVQQEWLRASAAITRELLSTESENPLALIARHTRELADAELVTVVRPAGAEGTLRVDLAVGAGAEKLEGLVLPVGSSISGSVFGTGEPMMGSWLEQRERLPIRPPIEMDVDAVLVVPLTGSGRVNGVLTAARAAGRPPFTVDDLEMAAGFANQASVAIELAEARAEQQRNALYDERERIAADLHSQVVRRLYSAGLALQTTAGLARSAIVARRVRETIADLDDVIDQIQATVFSVDDPADTGPSPERDEILRVLSEATPVLGFAVSTQFSGKLDTLVAADLVPFLERGLRLIAHHAAAAWVQVEIRSEPGRLTAVIRHDGTGDLEEPAAEDLAELAEAARLRGGTCEVGHGAEPGSVRWTVPTR
ncbi:GAF domain-containing protein [Amycolatopsis sp. NPDC051373]|uniref:sensor histidine kinase n=1 Tax=Amycolatopsis sp. NPDC051373 TaxID=3155801 RepID=UPI003450A5E7